MPNEITESLVELKEEKVIDLVRNKVESGEDPFEILDKVQEGMEKIGGKFDEGKYFVADLMLAGEIMEEIMEILKPHLAEEQENGGEDEEVVIMGTVQDDIHNLGKDIVITMLEANGFQVRDLGVDVNPEKFIKAIEEEEANVVGMSCLLVSNIENIEATIEEIEDSGLREDVRIMIGGGPLQSNVAEKVGADGFGQGANDAVTMTKDWIGGSA